MNSIEVYPIPALADNYIWAIKHIKHNNIIIVDPGESGPVKKFLANHNFSLHGIFLTHHHDDHTGGVKDLIQDTDIPIWGINIGHKNNIPTKDNTVTISKINLEFKVFDIPGHTLDHIAFYGHGAVFCGDTLFAGGMGRIFEGTSPQMYASVNKIANLPESTKMYCAHEYTLANLKFARQVEPHNQKLIARQLKAQQMRNNNIPTIPSTIAEELDTNPFLRAHMPEVQDAVSKHLNRPVTDELETFTSLRLWKDNF